jgi:Leucine-rich repeat (LRR) protein
MNLNLIKNKGTYTMCVICTHSYHIDTTELTLHVCDKQNSIPDVLVGLEQLTIYNKNIKVIPRTFVKLKSLCVGNIKITEIPDTLINLEYIDVSHTLVTSIPATLVNLMDLNVSNTGVTSIPSTLVNLRLLYMSNTKVSIIPNTLVELTRLDCGNTGVTSIPATLVNLAVLLMQSTKIQYLPDALNIGYLDCRRSDIISLSNQLHIGTLKCCESKIQHISCNSNHMTIIYATECRYLTYVKSPVNSYFNSCFEESPWLVVENIEKVRNVQKIIKSNYKNRIKKEVNEFFYDDLANLITMYICAQMPNTEVIV